MNFNTEQVYFCARECERQHSGEMSVGWMLVALYNAQRLAYTDSESSEFHHDYTRQITVDDILALGQLVEPTKNNSTYFRRIPVTIGEAVISWETIDHSLFSLLKNQENVTPTEFYQEFETIHPFEDGNGRVGAILYNWLRCSLDFPTIPPEYKKN
jgi:hypothetical protein